MARIYRRRSGSLASLLTLQGVTMEAAINYRNYKKGTLTERDVLTRSKLLSDQRANIEASILEARLDAIEQKQAAKSVVPFKPKLVG